MLDSESVDMLQHDNIEIKVVDGETVLSIGDKIKKLDDLPIDISKQIKNIKFCSFCGAPPDEDPFFTIDYKTFICKNCTMLAYNTFIQHGVKMPIDMKVSM